MPRPDEGVVAVGGGVGSLVEPAAEIGRREREGPEGEMAEAGLDEPPRGGGDGDELLGGEVAGELPGGEGGGRDDDGLAVDRFTDDELAVAADEGRAAGGCEDGLDRRAGGERRADEGVIGELEEDAVVG